MEDPRDSSREVHISRRAGVVFNAALRTPILVANFDISALLQQGVFLATYVGESLPKCRSCRVQMALILFYVLFMNYIYSF